MEPQEKLVITKIVSLSGIGLTQKDIAKQVGITPHQCSRLMKTPEYLELMANIGDNYLAEAKEKWTQGCARLLEKCLSVLKKRLDTNDLEAVKIAIRTLGIEKEEAKTGDTSINVILPGGSGDIVLSPSNGVEELGYESLSDNTVRN